MSEYRYLVADLLSGTVREEMPFQGVSYGDVLDAPGAFSATIPLSLKKTIRTTLPYSQTVRNDAPLGYWRLAEATGATANDASGNGRNGTYSGTVTRAATGLLTSDTNRAVMFAGGNVDMGDADAYSVGTTGTLTVEAIFSVTAIAGTQAIVAKAGAGSTNEWVLRVSSLGKIQMFVTDAAGTQLALAQSSAQVIFAGNTYHVVATMVQGGGVTVYVNGVNVGTDTMTGNTANTASTLRIAAKANGTNNLAGTVDEVALYPTTLSATRIAAHASSAAGTLETSSVSFDIVTRANLDPGRTAIYVDRDGVIQWGGILWTAQADDNGYNVSVGATGFWSYFQRRLIRTQQAYLATDQLAIFRALVNYAQAQLGGNIRVVVNAETCGVVRDQTYNAYDRTNLGQAGEDLAALQNGFDFAITSSYIGGVPTPTLNLSYPKRGTRTSHVLDLGTNIEGVEWLIDATAQATLIDALGAGEGAAMLISTAVDTSLLATYPLLEETISHTDVTVPATLAAWAAAELAATRTPVETIPSLVAHPDNDISVGQIITGDEVQVRALSAAGFLSTLNSIFRVLTWTVAVSDDGKETLTFGVAPTEDFV